MVEVGGKLEVDGGLLEGGGAKTGGGGLIIEAALAARWSCILSPLKIFISFFFLLKLKFFIFGIFLSIEKIYFSS